jgi:DNA-binding NarL/FixJ family response regulator
VIREEFETSLKPVEPADIFPELTKREREILSLMAQGYNNAEIAERLVLSGKTQLESHHQHL